MKDAQEERAHSLDRGLVLKDTPLAIPMMDIEELKKLTTFVSDVKKALMVEGKDYIVRQDKQYTARSGFAKLAQGFNLSDEILQEKELKKDGKFYGFSFTIRVFNQYGRQATGVGSCTMDEPNLQHHKDRPYHDVRSIAYTRAWNRAISNFVGSADVSAEEMSIGSEFEQPDRKEVDSQQSFPLPETFEIPTWNFAESLKAEGWGNVDNIFTTWVSNSNLNPEMFGIEVEPARAIVRTTVYLGESFGDVSRMLAKAGFKWRKKESRWVLMKPAGIS